MTPAHELERSDEPALATPAEGAWRVAGAAPGARSLHDLANEARLMIGAHQAVIRVAADESWSNVVTGMSFSERYAEWQTAFALAKNGADALWCPVFRPMRMTQDELAIHPAWRVLRNGARRRPPLRCWLAVPLCDRHGRAFGAVEICDKFDGDFDANDERRLIEFARSAAAALEGARPTSHTARLSLDFQVPAIHSEVGAILLRGGDQSDVLQDCASALLRSLDVALVRIWTAQKDVLELQASAGLCTQLDGPQARIAFGHTEIGMVAQARQPRLAFARADHGSDCNGLTQTENLHALAALPLVDDDELEGVIALYDRKPIPETVLQALTVMAQPLALFIRRQHTQLAAPRPSPVPPPADHAGEHAVISTNPAGAITDWNSGAEILFGYARRDVLGQPIARLAPPERAREDHDLLQKALRDECSVLPSTQRLRKDGAAIDVRITAVPQRGDAGKPTAVIFVAHDIREVRQLQQQVLIAQKMEVFGHLTGGVAHDFNNLLTVILGYSEILLRRVDADESTYDLIAEIRKAGQRAETLTRQLLAFSRKKVVEPQVLDLNAAVGDSEKMLRRLIGEDILISTILDPCLKPVRVDPGQIQQVVLNLAINAGDAMPDGGRLTIQTDNVALDEDYARRFNTRAGAYVRLTMADTGVGMSPDVLGRIFEPLFTTKGPGKGTGLGLATVRSIVKNAGGHIEVESEPGQGAAFKIFLPQVAEAAPAGKAHSGLHAIPRGNETVLLAEDEDTLRTLARQVLETCGYRVLEAANGEEASRLFERHQGAIHLLLSDVVMPYVNGATLAERLRSANPQLKVLFLTGYVDAATRYGVNETEWAFLQKPFTIRSLAQKVRDVLDADA
jgi:PAS domain S-box-containing protein